MNKLVIPRKVKAFSDAYVESTGNYKAISCDKLRESKMLYNIYESGETFDIYFNKVILPDIKMCNPEYTERKSRREDVFSKVCMIYIRKLSIKERRDWDLAKTLR